MKRIATWLLSTVSAVVLLFGYHTSTSGALTSAAATPTISGTSLAASGSSGTTSSGGTNGSGGSDGAGNGGSSTVTGDVAQTQWGPVQVQLTLSDGKITDVSVLQYPSGNPKDQEINSYALPILIQETEDSQSADIDMVSGATVTSEGYLSSLQSALDQAGI